MDINDFVRFQFKQPYWVLSNKNYHKKICNFSGIDHFYCFETVGNCEEIIVPDGCVDIIFRCDNNPKADIVGSGQKAILTIYPDNCYFFGVRFTPGAYYSIGNIAFKELNDEIIIPLDEVVEDKRMIEKILFSRDIVYQISCFWEMFAQIQKKRDCKHNPLFEQILAAVMYSGGSVSIKNLCALTHYSERRIRGVFNEYMGVSIKSMCDIIRFQGVMEYMNYQLCDDETLAELALKFGYYDQSHLNKEFKKYSMTSPRKYIKTVQNVNYKDKIRFV